MTCVDEWWARQKEELTAVGFKNRADVAWVWTWEGFGILVEVSPYHPDRELFLEVSVVHDGKERLDRPERLLLTKGPYLSSLLVEAETFLVNRAEQFTRAAETIPLPPGERRHG